MLTCAERADSFDDDLETFPHFDCLFEMLGEVEVGCNEVDPC